MKPHTHHIITPEGNPAGSGLTLAAAVQSAAAAYDTTPEAIQAALDSTGPDSLVHLEQVRPHPFDHFSARMKFPGGRVTKSFGAWLEECERHDAWHELPAADRTPTPH